MTWVCAGYDVDGGGNDVSGVGYDVDGGRNDVDGGIWLG